MLFTLIVFALVLSLLVLVHEMGHFWAARYFGMKPKEFGFGLPPRIFGYYKNKEGKWSRVSGSKEVDDAADTIYSFNWLPLGGFVNIGEDDIGSTDPNGFAAQAIWKRCVILLAGVTMNMLLAVVIISAGYMIGFPEMIDTTDRHAIVENRNIQIIEIAKDTSAQKSDLHVGDIIVSINEQNFENVEAMQDFLSSHAGDNLIFEIKREDSVFNKNITAEKYTYNGQEYTGIGIIIADIGIVKYPFFIAIWTGIKTTVFFAWAILLAFYNLIKDLIMGNGVSMNLAGPVGIAAISGRAARMGLSHIMQFIAILSVNLAIINALPFPALDGGRVLFLIIEKIKGTPVKREIEAVIHNVGFFLLIFLIILVTYRDIAKYSAVIKNLFGRLIGIN
jgi:regulator of sigma E protease